MVSMLVVLSKYIKMVCLMAWLGLFTTMYHMTVINIGTSLDLMTGRITAF
jgi:hypothetical protein